MRTRHTSRRDGWNFRNTLLAVLLLLAVLCGSVVAQPDLNIKRVTVNWPTIELYFSVGCNGYPTYNMAKQDFKLFDNGIEVKDFTLWCPDPTIRCAISVSLVFDASGSMQGSSQAGAKQAGNTFVDLMDGSIDQAAVLWFTGFVTVAQQMTILKPMLYSAIDALPASGLTAWRDGAYAGILELINDGVNQCRAVILMTDGQDNSSSRTLSEVISLANRHRIRVFTIGHGSNINAADLSTLALLTGGRYYQTTDAGQLAGVYEEIMTIIRQVFQECIITCERDCADGSMHTVELQLVDFCGGTDVKTKSYRAPLDATTFSDLYMQLGSVEGRGGEDITIPLNLLTPINGEMFYPFTFTLQYDTQCVQFKSVETPPGSLLEGLGIDVLPLAGGAQIRVTERKILDGDGKLMDLIFTTTDPADKMCCEIEGIEPKFDHGCFRPFIDTGEICILPALSISGTSLICEGESTVLTAPDGYASYLWSTSETTRSISVNQAGDYWVTVFTQTGDSATSPVFTVVVKPVPSPVVVAKGPLTFCLGRSVDLEAGGGMTFIEYQWSNGSNTSIITAREPGWYWVRVKDQNGCWAKSDSVNVTVHPSPQPVISIDGSTVLCEGDSVVLDAGEGYASYLWSTAETTRSIVAKAPGAYSVTVWNAFGCDGTATAVDVIVKPAPDTPVIMRLGDVLTTGKAEHYQWYRDGTELQGETNQFLALQEVGTYQVKVYAENGCSAMSDPFLVVTTEIDPPPTVHGFAVYPDPNQGSVTVRFSTEKPVLVTLELINLLGQSQLRLAGDVPTTDYTRQLDLRRLQPGVYILRVVAGEAIWTRRIVRQ